MVVTYAPLLETYFKDLQRLEKEAEEKEEEVICLTQASRFAAISGMIGTLQIMLVKMQMDWDRVPDFDWKAAKQRMPLVAIAMARDIVVSIVRCRPARIMPLDVLYQSPHPLSDDCLVA